MLIVGYGFGIRSNEQAVEEGGLDSGLWLVMKLS